MVQNSYYVYEIAMRCILYLRIHAEGMLIEEMKFSEEIALVDALH